MKISPNLERMGRNSNKFLVMRNITLNSVGIVNWVQIICYGYWLLLMKQYSGVTLGMGPHLVLKATGAPAGATKCQKY